jgi:small subunit ribosomal protein S3
VGQKINPNALRLGVLSTWSSRWFSNRKREFQDVLLEDIKLREFLMKRLRSAGVARVEIERSIRTIDVVLHVARPGVAIGRGGEELNKLKKEVEEFFKNRQQQVKIDLRIEPVKKPDLDPYLVARNVAEQIERRMPHKRVVSQAMSRVIGAGAKGVRIQLAGRINGAEISRTEKYSQGTVPLSTIREDVRYAKVPALTKSGYVGVKVWICK